MDVSSSLSIEEFTRAVLEAKTGALSEELSALKQKPREDSIHDTRVQSRRLRAALEVFQDLFPPRSWKPFYAQVRRITKTLGKAREREVDLKLLLELTSSGDMAEILCREYLEDRFRRSLRKRERQVRRGLHSLKPERLQAALDSLQSQLPVAGGPASSIPPSLASAESHDRESFVGRQPSLFQETEQPAARARRIVGALTEPLVSLRLRSVRRMSDERLHAYRIAGKKARYAMEIFDPVWPGGLENSIASAKHLQDTLGRYHDVCVLRQRLQKEIARLTRRKRQHTAFQISRIVARLEEHRQGLREAIIPAIRDFQQSLQDAVPRAVGTETRPEASSRRRPRPDARSPRRARRNIRTHSA